MTDAIVRTALVIAASGLAVGFLWGLFRDLGTRHLIDGRCPDCRMAAVRRALHRLHGFREV